MTQTICNIYLTRPEGSPLCEVTVKKFENKEEFKAHNFTLPFEELPQGTREAVATVDLMSKEASRGWVGKVWYFTGHDGVLVYSTCIRNWEVEDFLGVTLETIEKIEGDNYGG